MIFKNTVNNETTQVISSPKSFPKGPLEVPLGVTSLKFPVTEEQTDLILETQRDPILLLRSLPRPSFCSAHKSLQYISVNLTWVAKVTGIGNKVNTIKILLHVCLFDKMEFSILKRHTST